MARTYLAHRRQRLEQVRATRDALRAQQDREPDLRQIVEIVYADMDQVLWPAADASVAAQPAYPHGTPTTAHPGRPSP